MVTSPKPPTTIPVALAERGYDVHVGQGLLEQIGTLVGWPARAVQAAIITQAPVARHYLAPLEAGLRDAGMRTHVVEVPDGEAAKDVDTYGQVLRRLAQVPLGRGDVVVALGGGVVGDLAGFVAATYSRGVAVVQVPTTLLAQVDAAVGGKTGVNLPEGKNLVGAFHQPLAVVCDLDTLATLPERVRREGLAEVVKYGLIRDPVVLQRLEADPDAAAGGDVDALRELIERSVAVKAAVVAADERESGERAHLNLGHTYGHALETLTGYGEWLHGEAVAVGMLVALELGARTGRTPGELRPRVSALLRRLSLPTTAPPLDRDRVWEVMRRDKKARAGVRFVVLDEIAQPRVITPDPADVDAAIDAVTALTDQH